MISAHGSFAISYPANWTAPQFQFGQTVQSDHRTGVVVGINYFTSEQAAATESESGWLYWLLETHTLSNGKVISDVMGYHESVIQAVPCLSAASYECRVAV